MRSPLDPHAIHIFTDGSCLENPGGRGGAAAFVEYPDHLHRVTEQIVDFGCSETSNNRMELLACIKVLEWIRANRPWPSVNRVQVLTDSNYVTENLPRAVDWQSNQWRNLHGEAKQNSDLWKKLLAARAKAGMRVDFQWQRGKSSSIMKIVDRAAKAAARRGGFDRDTGFKSGKVSPSKVKGRAAEIFPAQGQTAVIRVYRKSAPIKDNQIRFHLFLEDTQEYVGSYYAYASDSLTLELHRQHLYRVKFNNNAHNPMIEEVIEEVFPFPIV